MVPFRTSFAIELEPHEMMFWFEVCVDVYFIIGTIMKPSKFAY